MNDDEILTSIGKSLKKIFNDENLKIDLNTKAKDIKQWDSLNHIKVVIELQKNLGIKVNSSDIHKYTTVKDFIKLKIKQSENKKYKK